MSKVIVIYESKYGNTKQAAEEIIAGIKETAAIEAILSEVKQVNFDDVIAADAILIGSPNHMGRATKSIRSFIDELGKINLNYVPVAVFDTCFSRECEKAVKKMEKQITEGVLSLKLITPGLSVKVKGTKGPILEEELPRCREFGVKFGEVVEENKQKE
ncbi:MAG: flavodoxin domain-containing protein [Dehalococcoidales bacterium]|nr:flavodoxin domain-containing protein [Dehalococcoidales bacterium]